MLGVLDLKTGRLGRKMDVLFFVFRFPKPGSRFPSFPLGPPWLGLEH